MELTSRTLTDGGTIPDAHAFMVPDPEQRAVPGPNRNPHLAWSDLPEGTRSLVLLCVDPDAPTEADDVNQEGRTVSAELPRTDFAHWVLVDIVPDLEELEEGAFSDGVTPGGKDARTGPEGTRQGINDYTGFLAGVEGMEGTYWGYDGPAPPWNDEIAHRYVFTLHALDVGRCPVDGEFTLDDVNDAITDRVLGTATLTCTYSLNPDVPA